MKLRNGIVLAVWMLSAVTVGIADDATNAKSIVEKAIKAHGGADKIKASKATTWTETGTYYGMGGGLPYTGQYAAQFPDQFRMEIVGAFIVVLNGDQGWVSANGQTTDMSPEQLKEQKSGLQASLVASLIPLTGKIDEKYKLSLIGDSSVNGKPAVGVLVQHEGRRDVSLYFDKESHLIAKIEHLVRSEELGGKEVVQEAIVSDYRKIDGLQVARKFVVNRDGQKFVEGEHSEFKIHKTLDDNTFSEP